MRVLLTTTILCLLSTYVQADTLMLKNGDRMSGTTLSIKDKQNLLFQSSFGQDMRIPWKHVKVVYDIYNRPIVKTRTAPTQQVARKQYTPVKLTPPGSNANIAQALTALKPVSIAQKAETKPPRKEDTNPLFLGATWEGRANVGGSLQKGNSDNGAFNADTRLTARWGEKHRAVLKAEYNYEEDDGDITENNQSFDGLYDYFFREKWFSNSVIGIESDALSNVDLRTNLGTGLGYQPYEQDDLNLKFIGGINYLRQANEDDTTESSAALRWYSDYDQQIWDDLFQVFHTHEFLVPTNDREDFLIDSSTGLRVPLKKGLVATAQVDFDWDNKPEPGTVEDDTEYKLKIGYEW